MTFTEGQRVWWNHLAGHRMFGTVEILEDRPGIRVDGDPDLLYLDADQLHTELPEGVHTGVPDTAYHADDSLSASGAKLLLPPSVPAKYRQARETPVHKPVFDFGKLCHTLVLGEGAPIEVCNFDDWRTKPARDIRDKSRANGLIPVLASEYDQAKKMTLAVRAHPVAGPLLTGGQAEISLLVTDPDTGVRLRARPDYMTQRDGRLTIADYKTAADANPDTFGKTAFNWGYHIQFAWYVHVARLLELDDNPAFVFVVQEKTQPFLVSVCELDADAFLLGYRQMRQAIHIYRECTEAGVWPGYSAEINPVSLPRWAFQTGPTIGDLLAVE